MNAEPSQGVSKHRPRYFTPKIKFTTAEDGLLRDLVQRYGAGEWRTISAYLGSRNPRQCRERWQNYLDPRVSDPREWDPEEDARLLAVYDEIGTRWSTLASYFPGRSTNNVKNRVVALHRRRRGRGRNGTVESTKKANPEISDAGESEQSLNHLNLINSIESAFNEPYDQQVADDPGNLRWFL
jgi:hypothetical protein